jgi:uncharacterized protein
LTSRSTTPRRRWRRPKSLGGKRLFGPDQVMPGVVIGQFTDPEGHVIGVVQTEG